MSPTRRQVVKGGLVLAAATASQGLKAAQAAAEIPRRPLGKTGLTVTALGIGGFHLGLPEDAGIATRIVHEAIDHGVNFFDNAWEYNQGKSEERMGVALQGKRDKVVLMTKVCTHGRDKKTALKQLEDSLRRLKTDHLDLWQVHEVVYWDDPERHFAKGGVIDALEEAKKAGKVRFTGFTGHKHPGIHLKMLEHGYAFDAVQMPLNCFDASFRSFEQQVVPKALERGMAVLGMKSMGGRGQPVLAGVVTAEEALRYAMSVPGIATTISGIQTLEVLRQNLAVAHGFQPMAEAERKALRERVAEPAGDGRFELYKTSMSYDAAEGRAQHGIPPPEELPL